MHSVLSTRRVFLIVVALGLFSLAVRNSVDPDVWWHVKTGEWITQHHAIPHTDPFSFTRAGAPWVAHEWLSEVLIYGLYRGVGWEGLIVVFAVILSATFFLLYLRCAASPYVAGLATLAGAYACVPTWDIRPQVLSFLLASVWLLILDRSERSPKLLWWTLPLTVLWVNLHAAFLLGPALLGLFLAGEMLEKIIGSPAVQSGARLRALSLFLLLNLLLIPLNPSGAKMFVYPLQTLDSQAMQRYISEWNSPDFHNLDYWPLLFLLLATFMIMAWSRRRLRPRDVLLLLVSTFAALSFVRMTPIFVLVAVPMVSGLLKHWPGRQQPSPFRARLLTTIGNISIVLATTVFATVHLVQVIQRQPQVEAAHLPAGAVAYLQSHPPGPLFNSYDWGGYLIFRLYPQTRVCIDGRADLYGDAVMREFFQSYFMTDNWQHALTEWNVATVLVPPDAPLASGLRIASGWSVQYEDSTAVIFSRSDVPGTSPRPE